MDEPKMRPIMEAAERLEKNPDFATVATYFGDLAGRRVLGLDPHKDGDDIINTLKMAQAMLSFANTVASLVKGLR